jgi:16S rRNA (cytidine1402-2'-O)-methyltransferase
MGTLFLVATPIGNLEDISARALRILGEARLIAAEDTRQTRKLLNHYAIQTRAISYHEHNKLTRLELVLAELEQGDVALVSDAGTPALNDPGYELVRAALQAGYRVSPVPGASAPLAALVASGLPTDAFTYLGYLPRQAGERRSAIQAVANLPYTLIFLETPHRLLEALADVESILGDRSAAVARELTKLHEEIVRGSLSQVRAHFEAHPPRGEITLIIGGKTAKPETWDEQRLRQSAQDGLAQGNRPSTLSARLARESGWPRREVYRIIQQISKAEID